MLYLKFWQRRIVLLGLSPLSECQLFCTGLEYYVEQWEGSIGKCRFGVEKGIFDRFTVCLYLRKNKV